MRNKSPIKLAALPGEKTRDFKVIFKMVIRLTKQPGYIFCLHPVP